MLLSRSYFLENIGLGLKEFSSQVLKPLVFRLACGGFFISCICCSPLGNGEQELDALQWKYETFLNG